MAKKGGKSGLLKDALSKTSSKASTKAVEPIKEESTEPVKEQVKRYNKHNEIKNHRLTEDGRKRFNTMLKPSLKKRLISYGHDHNQSIADVIEEVIATFLDEKGY